MLIWKKTSATNAKLATTFSELVQIYSMYQVLEKNLENPSSSKIKPNAKWKNTVEIFLLSRKIIH